MHTLELLNKDLFLLVSRYIREKEEGILAVVPSSGNPERQADRYCFYSSFWCHYRILNYGNDVKKKTYSKYIQT